MPTKKLVLVQGLDVSALAVNVLLIYFSQAARHINKENSVGSLPQTWASDISLGFSPLFRLFHIGSFYLDHHGVGKLGLNYS